MNSTDREIARTQEIFAREEQSGRPSRMALAAFAGRSRPHAVSHVTHARTWRDCLVEAGSELREEDSDTSD
jgi:hypothetical protein